MHESYVNTSSDVLLFLQQIIAFFCQLNYEFSKPCKLSLTTWKKKNDVLQKGQTNGLPVPDLPRTMQRRKM